MMTDNESVESLHSLDSSLNINHKDGDDEEENKKDYDGSLFVYVGEEKKNDDDSMDLQHDIVDQQATFPRGPSGAMPRTTQVARHHQDQNSLRENATLDSDSIYTSSNNGQKLVAVVGGSSSKASSSSNNGAPSKHSAETTRTKGGTASLNPSGAGSYMSVEVNLEQQQQPSGYPDTPNTNQWNHIIDIVQNNNDAQIQNMVNAQVNNNGNELPAKLPNKEGMTPPNMVTLNNNNNNNNNNINLQQPRHPFQNNNTDVRSTTADSTDDSLYTDGHNDASTITKDTFLKQQDYTYQEQENQAFYNYQYQIDPEAPQQEATPDYDAYYDPNAYGGPPGISFTSSHEEGSCPSIGHSTVTSLTKDTGILRMEQPDADGDLPVSRGIMTGEDVSYLTPPRMDRSKNNSSKNKKVIGTPSTIESGGVVKDEEYDGGGAGGVFNTNNNKEEPSSSLWVFLQNATRDPTVQCLISLACIFAVILFFLVAVIIVLTSEDISI